MILQIILLIIYKFCYAEILLADQLLIDLKIQQFYINQMQKQTIVITLSVILALAAAGSLTKYILNSKSNFGTAAEIRAFDEWRRVHQKAYGTPSEYNERLSNFKASVKRVQDLPKTATYKLALNKFSDLSVEEFKAKYLGRKATSLAPKIYDEQLVAQAVKAPSNWDWTTKGAVTPVKNQGQCGSCWSFSSTGALEGLNFLVNGRLTSMSEQQLMDCSWLEGNMGCNGGLQDRAFSYVQRSKGGLVSEADYPYTAKSSFSCKTGKLPRVFQNTGHRNVIKHNDALMAAIAQQPVAVSIDAETIMQYHSGIFNNRACGQSIDHAVLGVGYGAEGTELFWKIKNSWGADWGEQGYIRFERATDQSTGICGILLANSYPIA